MKLSQIHRLYALLRVPTVFTALLIALLMPSPLQAAQDYLLVNANLIDPASQSLTRNAWIQIADGKIAATGTGMAPALSQRIDLAGAYVMPGLIDAHLHLTAGPLSVEIKDGVPALSMASQEEITRFHAQAALASGVTSAFSPAGDPIANQRYAEQQRTGQLNGPTLQYAGLSFDPMPIEGGTVYPADAEAWRTEIARQKALGARYIKLYHGLSEEELRLGVALTRQAGLKSIAHLDQVSWQIAADAGVDALTHAFMPSADLLPESARAQFEAERTPGTSQYLYRWFELADYQSEPLQTLFRTLAERQVRVDLTLIVNEMMYFFPQLDALYPASDWQLHPAAAASWRQNMGMSVYGWTEDDFRRAQAVFPKVLQLVQQLHQAGIPLLPGSDSYGAGDWFWRELELHQRAGLSQWRILQMATSDAARLLQLPHAGQLRAGFDADLIVLADNPLADVAALKTVNTVIQRGQRHSVTQLRAELAGITRQANAVAQAQ